MGRQVSSLAAAGAYTPHTMGTNMNDNDDAPITTREWIRALAFCVVGGALVTAAIVWFAFSFIFQSCGYGPACG